MVNTKIFSLPLLYHHHLLSLFLSHYPKYSCSSISNPNSPISIQTRHPPYSFRLPTTQFYLSLILFSLLRLSGFTPSHLSQGFRFLTLRGFCCAPQFIRIFGITEVRGWRDFFVLHGLISSGITRTGL